MPRALPLALLLAAAASAAGCVEPMLRIRSEPMGLPVTLNGRPVGVTPVDVPFAHYGTVRLETPATDLDGDGWPEVRRHVALVELPVPWYQWFPVDFFADNLIPWTVHDVHEAWLVPGTLPAPSIEGEEYQALRRAAAEAKVRAEQERTRAEIEAGLRGEGEETPREPDRR